MVTKPELVTTPATRKQRLYLYALTKDPYYLEAEYSMEDAGKWIGVNKRRIPWKSKSPETS